MSWNKIPTEICEGIADFLYADDTEALIKTLVYTRRYAFEILRLLKYFASRKFANGLFYAVRYNKRRLLQRFLQIESIDVNIQDINGQTPLLIASQKGNLEAVKMLLLKPGINANALNYTQRTPLGVAVIEQHAGIVEALLHSGKADLRIRDLEDSTMLHLGIARGGPGISRQVVVAAQPSDFTLNNMSGCNPLMTLVDRGFSDLFAIFLSKDQAPATGLLEQRILSYAVASG